MRFATTLLMAAAIAFLFASETSAYEHRDVAFVTLVGQGTVSSLPHGIDCPKICRGIFVRGTHLSLSATAAPGWRFAGFRSKWCNGTASPCVFDLVSPHDCIGGACPLGAFGVRALFVRSE